MDYPEPLVIPPRNLPHKQTFIILHGRGSSGEKFGPALLDTPFQPPAAKAPVADGADASETNTAPATLAATFPHARFVFPTAARRRATVYGRAYTHQWFNNWKLDPPATAREDLQAPGLRETTAYLHGLLRDEAAAVPGGASSVVLGGLSQGCAAALVSLLLWEGEPFAAVFGMCGWLPYATRLSEQMSAASVEEMGSEQGDDTDGGKVDEDAFDPFERGDDSDTKSDPPTRAMNWLREEIQLERSQPKSAVLVFKDIPVFLRHGVEDDRVSVVLGRAASRCVRDLGVEADWKEYEQLGHWYSAGMLHDVVSFIRSKTQW